MKIEVERAPFAEPGLCVICDQPIHGSPSRESFYCTSTCRAHRSKFWAWFRHAKRPSTLPERQRGLSTAQRRAFRYQRLSDAGEPVSGPPPKPQTIASLPRKTGRRLP